MEKNPIRLDKFSVALILISGIILNVNGLKKLPSESDLKKCLKDDLFPVYNNQSDDFDCFKLTTQGPCSEGELLFLEEDLSEAYCSELPCQISDFILYQVLFLCHVMLLYLIYSQICNIY